MNQNPYTLARLKENKMWTHIISRFWVSYSRCTLLLQFHNTMFPALLSYLVGYPIIYLFTYLQFPFTFFINLFLLTCHYTNKSKKVVLYNIFLPKSRKLFPTFSALVPF